MERGKSVGSKTEGDPRVSPNSCHINKTHSQAETKRNRGIDGKIQESESEPVIHMSEQTWVRSGNETARRRENRACTLLDKYTLTPLHVPTHTHKNTHSHHNIKPSGCTFIAQENECRFQSCFIEVSTSEKPIWVV